MQRKCKNWTISEEIFLKDNYPLKGALYCAIHLQRTQKGVIKKACRLNIKVSPDVRLSLNKEAQNLYQAKRCDDDFSVNIEQFLRIKKEEVAYILGFIWADGYILESRGEIRIEILKVDMVELKPVLEKLGAWSYSYRTNRKTVTASTTNRKLTKFLIEHDYLVKLYESADKILSKIPDKLKHYFFRGLIDGDGCFYVNLVKGKQRLSISSGITQKWEYVQRIANLLGVKCNVYRKFTKRGNSSFIEFNNRNAKIFGDYIYQNYNIDSIGFKRKYEKFSQLSKIKTKRLISKEK